MPYNPYLSYLNSQMSGYGANVFSRNVNDFGGSKFGSPTEYNYGDPNFLGSSIKTSPNNGGSFPSGIESVGSNVSNYGGAALSAFQSAMQIDRDIKNSINTFRDADTSASGMVIANDNKPIYTLSDEIIERDALGKTEAGKGLVGRSLASGAAAGASVGSIIPGIGPGIGTAIGGVIGGIVGGITGLFGKKKAKKEKSDAMRKFNENILREQLAFNNANIAYGDAREAEDVVNLERENRMLRLNEVVNTYYNG